MDFFTLLRFRELQRQRQRQALLQNLLFRSLFDDDSDDEDYFTVEDYYDDDDDDDDDYDNVYSIAELFNDDDDDDDDDEKSIVSGQISNTSVLRENESDTDKPTIPWGSVKGQQLRKEADDWKERGNKAVKDKKYEIASDFYTTALEVAVEVKSNEKQIATLLSNRSYVSCELHAYQQAIKDAENCTKCNPKWYKGYLRLMKAYKANNDFQQAFEAGVTILLKTGMTNDEEISCFVEVVMLVTQVDDTTSLKKLNIEPQRRDYMIQGLVKQNAWSTISFLIQGKDKHPLVLTAAEYRARDIDLSGLLQSCSVQEWKDWGQRLAVKLLQAGTKKESLDVEGKYAIHAAFKVGMRTGVYELLKHMFLNYIPMGDRDRVDGDGNTLLHLACRDDYSTKVAAIKLLLEHNVNPTCRNKAGQRPLDLLDIGDKHRTEIIQAMEAKGFEMSSIITPTAKPKRQSPDKMSVSPHPKPFPGQDPPMPQSSAGPDFVPSTSLLSRIYHGALRYKIWTPMEVEKWLKDNNLTGVTDKLKGMCGTQLSELHLLQQERPTAFYQLLHDNLHLSIIDLLKLSKAIRHLI